MEKFLGAVIWDMDGVLVDTGEYHYQAWRDILAQYQIPFSRETFAAEFGTNNKSLVRKLFRETFTTELYQKISNEKEQDFRHRIQGKIQLLPGVRPLLDRLADAGIPQAVGSSAPQENIDAIVDSLGLRRYFQALVSAADMPGKPDPLVFLTAARALQAPPNRCLVIEDALAGVEAARRAGMKCLAITTTNPADKLAAADRVVEEFTSVTVADLVMVMQSS